MKKIAIATIIALASGAAMAQVEIYGKLRTYQEMDKVGTAGSVTKMTNDTSRIGFRGREDLGNGLNARFVIETSVGQDAPAATSLGDRESLLGIGNKFAGFDMGRAKHTVARLTDRYDAMGGNIYGSSVGTIHALHGSRISNASFISVNPASNVTLSYNHGYKETAGQSALQAAAADVRFGPASVGVATLDDSATNSKSTIIGGKFDVKQTGTSLFGMYSDDRVNGVNTEGKTIGVAQKLAPQITALASYGEKQGMKAYAAGLTYNFSKRTMLHARYKDEQAVVAANDRKQFGLGIEHNF